MAWQVFYHVQVENDILFAKRWYKQQQIGLEKRFVLELKNAINKIQNNPLLYEVRYRDIRIKHLNVFPFGVHYQINNDFNTIIIVGILHHRQHPDTFNER